MCAVRETFWNMLPAKALASPFPALPTPSWRELASNVYAKFASYLLRDLATRLQGGADGVGRRAQTSVSPPWPATRTPGPGTARACPGEGLWLRTLLGAGPCAFFSDVYSNGFLNDGSACPQRVFHFTRHRHQREKRCDGSYARLVAAPARACFAVLPCTSGRMDRWCTGGPGHSW